MRIIIFQNFSKYLLRVYKNRRFNWDAKGRERGKGGKGKGNFLLLTLNSLLLTLNSLLPTHLRVCVKLIKLLSLRHNIF